MRMSDIVVGALDARKSSEMTYLVSTGPANHTEQPSAEAADETQRNNNSRTFFN
jgi:hypothetical protein